MSDKETLYGRWLAGELTDQELKDLEASGELEELKRIVTTVDRWATPEFDVDNAYNRLQRKKAPNSDGKSNAKVYSISPTWVLGIAASLLLLAALIFLLRADAQVTVLAPYTSNEIVNLTDGTIVQLNDGSSLSYVDDLENLRKVELEGEAFFKVTKGERFRVLTEEGEVTVLGTEFNVRTWEESLEVVCYEGSVRVARGDAVVILKAGDGVTFVNGDRPVNTQINEEGPLWLQGISRFKDIELSNVFQELERQYDCTVSFNPTGQKYSGQFRHDDLESAVRNICLPLGLQFEISPDQKQVTISSE